MVTNALKMHIWCLENEDVGRGKWACFRRQDSPGRSNFSKTLIGIGTSGVNRLPKKSDPEKCADQFGNRSVSNQNLHSFRSACF